MTRIYVIAIFLLFILAALAYFFRRFLRKQVVRNSLALDLLLIKIPRGGGKEASENAFLKEIGRFEQLIANLSSNKKPVIFETAVHHVGEEIHFYLAVQKIFREIASKQIQGLWPGASVALVRDDYTIFNAHGVTAAAYLVEKDTFAIPIRTYRELEADTLGAILSGFAKINEIGEGAALQLILRPASKEKRKQLERTLISLKKGESRDVSLGTNSQFSAKEFMNVFQSPKKKDEKEEPKIIDEALVKAVESKLGKPLFEVNMRVVVSAASPFQANDILDGILTSFEQFASPDRNQFKIVKAKNPTKLAEQFIFRTFDASQLMTLTSEEVASIYHLPVSTAETPKVKWLKSHEAPPPNNLPTTGTLIGESSYQGQSRPVYITDDDRRRHVYIIGQTGTGKSVLLNNMTMEDMAHGKGFAVIDPHGEFAQFVVEHIPENRLEDVIMFDPADLSRPIGLNMLDYDLNRPEQKTFIVNEMQDILTKLFPDSGDAMGPMFQQYMRNALLLLMEDMANEPATLVEVPRVFTDAEYRNRKLARIKNPVVIDFWEKEATKAGGEASLQNITPYITSKFGQFISNDFIRPIIGQPKSAFNFRELMDSGKILIVNLSKGRIGDINAELLGMIFTGKILMAALSRVDIPDLNARRDFNLYMDEFHNFTTPSIASILSEARKYRLSLTIAHQFIAQLTEPIRDAVFGNVGSEVVFRVGVQDADFLVKQFEPVFNENDLQNIDNLNAYAKILINGETSKPFNIKIGKQSWAGGDKARADKLREFSRLKYGHDRAEVEADIFKRLRE